MTVAESDVDVACTFLVLTGGASSRLGTDKASVLLDGTSLRERVITALPQGRVHELGAELSGGPASAVISYLPQVSTPLVALVAVDMPFAAPMVMRLAAEWSTAADRDGLVPVDAQGREQWLAAVYSTTALSGAADGLRDAGVVISGLSMRALTARLSITRVPLGEADIVSAMDIDTPADLAAVRSLMRRGNADGA